MPLMQRRRRPRWPMAMVAMVLGATGCNQIFGLDPTELRTGDGGGGDDDTVDGSVDHDGPVNTTDGGDPGDVDARIDGHNDPGDHDGDGIDDGDDNCPDDGNHDQH